jgi:hypothetical protein
MGGMEYVVLPNPDKSQRPPRLTEVFSNNYDMIYPNINGRLTGFGEDFTTASTPAE